MPQTMALINTNHKGAASLAAAKETTNWPPGAIKTNAQPIKFPIKISNIVPISLIEFIYPTLPVYRLS